jgi:hypothetical protein
MNNLILSTTNEIYLIVIGLVVTGLIVFFSIYIKKHRAKKISELFEKVAKEKGFSLQTLQNDIADYSLENDSKKLLIKLVYVPSNSSITINSKTTWNLRYGGSGTYGKSYSNQRYLNELIPFLKYEPKNTKQTQKVIVVYPKTNKIEKYLNESDIAIIKYKDLSYGYKVIKFIDFDEYFEDLV